MHFNFSFKKAWNDLFSNKKYAIELLYLMLLMIGLMTISEFSSFKLLPILGYVIWTGYIALMGNNIINGKEPVLADIFVNENGRNIFVTAFKFIGLSIIYGLCFGILWALLTVIFTNLGHVPEKSSIFYALLISLPFMIFVSIFGFLLFSENLKFKEGFNFKRSLISIKYGWKDYLATFGVLILLYIVGLFLIIALAILISLLIGVIAKSNNIIPPDAVPTFSRFIGLVLGNILGFPLGYLYNHILAQSYKSAISKIPN